MIYVPPTFYEGTYQSGAFDNRSAPYARRDYGAFTGASQDEASLIRLGGRGPSSQTTYRPFNAGSGDLIDRIRGQR